jgi:hypothetical protein
LRPHRSPPSHAHLRAVAAVGHVDLQALAAAKQELEPAAVSTATYGVERGEWGLVSNWRRRKHKKDAATHRAPPLFTRALYARNEIHTSQTHPNSRLSFIIL